MRRPGCDVQLGNGLLRGQYLCGDRYLTCHAPCTMDQDCPTGGTCATLEDGTGECEVPSACVADDATCGPDTGECCDGLCITSATSATGTCRKLCSLSSDCPSQCCGNSGAGSEMGLPRRLGVPVDAERRRRDGPRAAERALGDGGLAGDVQPMLVLAEELCRRGHRVRMAAPPNFEQMVTRAGLGFLPIGTDTAVFLERHGALVEKNPLVALPRQVALIRAEAERQIRDLLATTERAELVVGAGLAFGASTLADRDGVRYVYLSFTLSGIRSREYPPAPLPVFGLPRWANAALWAGIVGLFDRALADTITRQRRAHGLGPVPAWHSIHGSHTLLAQDTILGALPADAVGCIGQVPALTSLAPLVPLSPEVEEFLGDDAAPARPRRVYLGFGSMPSADQGRLFALSSEVGRRTRARSCCFRPMASAAPSGLDEHVFRIAENDHRALFPRMDLVVHHGGRGRARRRSAPGLRNSSCRTFRINSLTAGACTSSASGRSRFRRPS